MIDPSLPIQKAILTVLSADAGMKGLVGDTARVYDRIPDRAAFPYITISDADVADASAQCFDGAETVATVHVWSREPGRVEAKRIAARVALLLDAAIAIEGHRVDVHEIAGVLHMGDPDGLTSHSVVRVRYETSPTS